MNPSAAEIVQTFIEQPDMRPGLLAPDVEFLPLTNEVAYGPAAVLRTIEDIAGHFHSYDVQAERLISVDGGRVLVHLCRTGVSLRGNLPVTDHFAQVYSVRHGLITRIESFRTPEEASESVG